MKKKKNAKIICYMLMSLVCLQQRNVKNPRKLMKIVNIDEEHLHTFQMTCEISIEFSEKMCLMIVLKVTKNQGFKASLWKI